jgi:hypothetical protein
LKSELPSFLVNINLTDRKVLIVCLALGFFVRLVPELLAFPLPIGWDTIHYAVAMKSGVVWANWGELFTSSWLLYSLIVPLYALVPIDPFMLLKIIAPLLFGLNVAGIYWFSRKMLGWNLRMGLLAGVFFALQLASLRISWDLLRNTLGLGILLFTLPYINKVDSTRGLVIFVLLSLLTVFAHQYAALTLLVIVLCYLVTRLFKGRFDFCSKRLALAILPALAIFLLGLILTLFPVNYSVPTNVIETNDVVRANTGGVFFLVNYLQIQSSVDHYVTYWNLVLAVGLLSAVLYLPYLFLVVKGFFKNSILNFWTGFLLIGAFGCLIIPFSALQYWYRYMFMLVYPLTFYAVAGISKLTRKFSEVKHHLYFGKKAAVAAMVLLTFSLAFAYLATPVIMLSGNENVASLSGNGHYFSTTPTVPYEDVNSVVQALRWLDGNMNATSCVLLQHAFLSWGQLYLNKSNAIVHFEIDPSLATKTALDHNFAHIYFIWWDKSVSRFGVSVPGHFVNLQNFGRISVYVYNGENVVES